jgi:hypothetical protein
MLDEENFYTITTRGLVFDNMMVDRERIQQTSKMLSATPIEIAFKQVLLQSAKPTVCLQHADSSLVDRGVALVGQVKSTIGSLADKVAALL